MFRLLVKLLFQVTSSTSLPEMTAFRVSDPIKRTHPFDASAGHVYAKGCRSGMPEYGIIDAACGFRQADLLLV
jgi:hypothetical protein